LTRNPNFCDTKDKVMSSLFGHDLFVCADALKTVSGL